MRLVTPLLIIQLAFTLHLCSGEPAQITIEQIHQTSWRGTVDGIPVMVLRGDHKERAFAHGILSAHKIIDLLNGYVLKQAGGKTRYERYLIPLISRMHWRTNWNQELDSMLAGIEHAIPNVRKRSIKSLRRRVQREDLAIANALADWAPFACSSLSVWGKTSSDGIVRSARNLDYPGNKALIDGMCLILHINPKDNSGMLNLGWYGGLGAYTAINHHGVFTAIHDVAVLPPQGMKAIEQLAPQPRTLAIRDALMAAKVGSDMVHGLNGVPVLMGNNLAISDPQGAAIIAWSKHTHFAADLITENKLQRIACTNHHPNHPADLFPDSAQRLRALSENPTTLSVTALKSKLQMVSRPTTIHSVIAEPVRKHFLIALQQRINQPATSSPWVGISWHDLAGHRP